MNKVATNPQLFYSAELAEYYYDSKKKLIGDQLRLRIPSDAGLPQLLGEQHFLIKPQGTRWLDSSVLLETTISAITKTGGSYVRGIDAMGIFMINNIEVRYGSEPIGRITAAQMYQIYEQMMWEDERDLMSKNVGIAVAGTRATNTAAAQTFLLDLSHLFGIFGMPFPIFKCNQPLEIVITYHGPTSLLVETDGTAPAFSFVSSNIYATYTEAHPAVTAAAINKQVWSLYGYEFLEQQFDIPAGVSNSFNFNLQQLNNRDVILINTMIRPSANLTTPLAPDYTTATALSSYTLKSSNNYISGANFDYTDTFMRQVLLHDYDFPSKDYLITKNYYPISYSNLLAEEFSDDGNKYTGSRSFRNVTDAQLTLKIASTVGTAQKVYVNAICARRLFIGQRGEIKISQ
jgi:hypothetical protein